MSAAVLEVEQERTAYIYALRDPGTGEVRYIGKTKDPAQRLREHCRPSQRQTKTYRNHWLRNLASQGLQPRLTVLEEVAEADWQRAETEWIAFYRALRARLTNSTDGGEGGAGAILSASELHRRSVVMTARWADPVYRALNCQAIAAGFTQEGMARKAVKARTRMADPAVHAKACAVLRANPGPPMRGELNGHSKLTEADVLAMRNLIAGGSTLSTIAQQFGVAIATAQLAVTGQTWAHVAGPLFLPKRHLTEAERQVIVGQARSGMAHGQVADSAGISRSRVSQLVRADAARRKEQQWR